MPEHITGSDMRGKEPAGVKHSAWVQEELLRTWPCQQGKGQLAAAHRAPPEQGEGSPASLPPSGPLVMPICHQAGISIKPPKEGSGVTQTRWQRPLAWRASPGPPLPAPRFTQPQLTRAEGRHCSPARHSRGRLSIKLTSGLPGMQPPPLPPSPSGSEWSRQHLGRRRAPGSREGRAGGHGKAPGVVPGSALCSLAFDQSHLAISRQSNGRIHLKHRRHPSPAPASFTLSGSPLTAIPAPLPHEHPVMVSHSSPPLDSGTQLFFSFLQQSQVLFHPQQHLSVPASLPSVFLGCHKAPFGFGPRLCQAARRTSGA